MTKLTGNALHVLGPSPAVTLAEFEKMWALWSVGNKEDAYIEVAYAVRNKKLLNGTAITFELLRSKYEQYVKFAQGRSPDPKFVASIANWMRKSRYNEEFIIPHNPSIRRVIK